MKKTVYLLGIFLSIAIINANTSPITYKNITHVAGINRPISIHILKIDPSQFSLILEHANNGALSREPVSKIAARKKAVAAINASFYRRGGEYNGNSLGILKIDDVLYSDVPLHYGALGWSSKDNNALIDVISIGWKLEINNETIPVNRLNQPLKADEVVIYTPIFGQTTRTKKDCTEITVTGDTITSISKSGNTIIPKNGYVIAIGKNVIFASNKIKPGNKASLHYSFKSKQNNNEWNQFDYIVSGAGILVKNGTALTNNDFNKELSEGLPTVHTADEVVADFSIKQEREWFIRGDHPRTAIGFTKTNKWILVVVDGRNKAISQGMSLEELAWFMKDQGCINALNLGGGGCTTMYYNEKVVNNTSGSSLNSESLERPVSDALLVLPK